MCGMLDLSHSAALSPQPTALHHAVGVSHNIQPLADNFEVFFMQKQTTAEALEPDFMTSRNIYMMLSFLSVFSLFTELEGRKW